MPTIRIDDEVWQALKSLAEPFVDTPNDVLRRVLLLDVREPIVTATPQDVPKTTCPMPSTEPGARTGLIRTPEKEFRIPILRSLVDLGGEAAVPVILKHLRRYLKVELKPDDFKPLKSGETRWENTAKWERKRLKEDRLLDESRQGVWKISQLGRQYLQEHLSGR